MGGTLYKWPPVHVPRAHMDLVLDHALKSSYRVSASPTLLQPAAIYYDPLCDRLNHLGLYYLPNPHSLLFFSCIHSFGPGGALVLASYHVFPYTLKDVYRCILPYSIRNL